MIIAQMRNLITKSAGAGRGGKCGAQDKCVVPHVSNTSAQYNNSIEVQTNNIEWSNYFIRNV